ncbi:hypothetical protein ACQ4PT_050942 [Festuca glaucescens]
MGKPKGKRAANSSAAAKKEKATGWVASTFSKSDLNKIRAAGLLAASTVLHQLTPNSILHIACFITLCECFLGINPHWGLWRRIFCIRRNVSRTDVHDVGGAIISTRSPTSYFDLRMRDSVQDWRKKWFYVKDEPVAGQKYGLAPLDAAAEVKKLKSWDIPLTDAELEEMEPMIRKIKPLQTTMYKELSGLQLMAFFIRMRIKPLQARAYQMWNYSGSADETRISKDDVAEDEVKKTVRRLTTLTAADEVPIACQAEYFDKVHPTPPGHRFLSSPPPLPEGGDVPEAAIVAESEAADTGATPEADDDDEEDVESEASQTKVSPPSATSREEKKVEKKRKRVEVVDDSESLGESSPTLVTPLSVALPFSPYAEDPFTMGQILSTGEGLHTELPITDEGAGLDDFVVAKVNGPLATTAESPKLDDFEGIPRLLAKKKAKTSGALKGIQMSSTPSSPPRDHSFSANPFTASADLGSRNPKLAPEVHLDSEVTTPPPEAPDSFLSDEQGLHIKELEGELTCLKKQLLVALDRAKHVVECDKQLQNALEKLTRFADREDYLLDMALRASDDLICIRMDPDAENRRVKNRVQILTDMATAHNVDFWFDRRRTTTMVLLQDRAAAVNEYLEYCRSTLSMVYSTMFPQNDPIEGLDALLQKFSHTKDIRQFVRIQLVVGTKFALSWVLVHQPRIDLDVLSRCLSSRRDPRGRMDRFYEKAREPALRIIRKLLESDGEYFTSLCYADDDDVRAPAQAPAL